MSSAAKNQRSTSRVSKKKTAAPKEGAAKKGDKGHRVSIYLIIFPKSKVF